MRKKYLAFMALWVCFNVIIPQNNNDQKTKPKLVVGIVIDQMKWEYLQRFSASFSEKGAFKMMMNHGFECANTQYNYIPTVTAAGHASVYTGSTPALHGIVGNDWLDRKTKKEIYCTDDYLIKEMSPQNLWATTITDELRLFSQFKSRVYGVALKDRGAILPAGHNANAAIWYDKSLGNWISSSYYDKNETHWLEKHNTQKQINDYYQKGWSLLKNRKDYITQVLDGDDRFHNKVFGEGTFLPYQLNNFISKDYSKILSTPWGNSLTIDIAKKLIEEKALGREKGITDFLTISFSSTDYVGHAFGPNSLELEDTYLRLDKELGEFFSYLEEKYGNEFLVFLTADHGVSHIPQYLESRHTPGKSVPEKDIVNAINTFSEKEWKTSHVVMDMMNAQLYLDIEHIPTKPSLSEVTEKIKQFIRDSLADKIIFAIDLHHLGKETLPHELKEKIQNGFSPTRSGDIALIFKSGYLGQYGGKGTTHFSPYRYDTHVPLLFWGWNIPKGRTHREIYITDIAVTISALLEITQPSATIGKPIVEILYPKN